MIDVRSLIAWRKLQDRIFSAVGIICTTIGLIALAALLIKLLVDGGPYLSFHFLTSRPSEIFPQKSGISTAIVGTLAVIVVTFLAAVPLGVSTAVYLEEYARKNWFTDLIEINISNPTF